MTSVTIIVLWTEACSLLQVSSPPSYKLRIFRTHSRSVVSTTQSPSGLLIPPTHTSTHYCPYCRLVAPITRSPSLRPNRTRTNPIIEGKSATMASFYDSFGGMAGEWSACLCR